MGKRSCDSMNFREGDYLDTAIHNVPDAILRPVHQALNQNASWHDLIPQGDKLDDKFCLKDHEIADISMAVMTFANLDRCSERLIREYGSRGMTLRQLAQCLYATGKFERALMESNILSPIPLEITRQPQTCVDVLEGTNLELDCAANGFPYPRYTWFVGDTEISQSVTSGKLLVTHISQDQAGKYTCRIHNLNRECKFSNSCVVKVVPNPHPPPNRQVHCSIPAQLPTMPTGTMFPDSRDFTLHILRQTSDQHICKAFGQTLRLECVGDGYPPPYYQWYFNDTILANQTHHMLTIQSLRLRDSGQYYCRVSNNVHPAVTSQPTHVTVTDSKQALCIVEQPCSMSVEEGASNVTLTCRATSAMHQLVYRWFHNKNELLPNAARDGGYTIMKGELHIDHLELRHGGEYACLVAVKHATTGETMFSKYSESAKLDVTISSRHYKKPTAKVALFIGCSKYRNELADLPAIVLDLDATKTALEEMDFKVLSFVDLSLFEMNTAVNLFCEMVHENSYVLLYFAGHGFADNRNQYIIPSDAPHGAHSDECLCMEQVHATVMKHNPAMCVVVKDVCNTHRENPRPGLIEPVIIPTKGKSYIINTASFGQKSYEDRRGIFNKIFVDIMKEELPVKKVFNRTLERFREHLERYGENYPQHPIVQDDLQQYKRSFRDPIDTKSADVDKLDHLAKTWHEYHRIPDGLPIEAANYKLSLSTTFTARHTNWLVIQVVINSLGLFQQCRIELRHVPKEIGGPTIITREEKGVCQPNVFLFDVKNIQRLQKEFVPELFLECITPTGESTILSTPIENKLLQYPLISCIENWRPTASHPPLTRVPTETPSDDEDPEAGGTGCGKNESDV